MPKINVIKNKIKPKHIIRRRIEVFHRDRPVQNRNVELGINHDKPYDFESLNKEKSGR